MGNYARITRVDREAFEELRKLRWPGGVHCPKCGREHPSFNEKRLKFQCRLEVCRYQFSVTSGTHLHGLRVGLGKTLAAMLMVFNIALKDKTKAFQLNNGAGFRISKRSHERRGTFSDIYTDELEAILETKSQKTMYRILKLAEYALEHIQGAGYAEGKLFKVLLEEI